MSEALEIEIETQWVSLCALHPHPITGKRPCREYSLTPRGRLVFGEQSERCGSTTLVGTFTNTISLQDFRDAVFSAWDELHQGKR